MAKSTNTGSNSEKKRTSFILHADTMKKIKYISLMDEKDITTSIDEALQDYISKWEKKNGPIPKK